MAAGAGLLLTVGAALSFSTGPTQAAALPLTGKWADTGATGDRYLNHAAVLLSGPRCGSSCGKVLIAGGDTVITKLYDPATGQFTRTGDLPSVHRYVDAVMLPDRGEVLLTPGTAACEATGGTCGPLDSPPAPAIYSIAGGTWSSTAPTNLPHSGAHAVVIQGTACAALCGDVLLVGGFPPGDHLYIRAQHAELFDPARNSWRLTRAIAPASECQPSTGNQTCFYEDTGTTLTVLPTGAVLASGGGGDELFDPLTETFHASAQSRLSHTSGGAALLRSGKVLVFGGPNDVPSEIYDPVLDLWTPSGVMTYQPRNVDGRAVPTVVLSDGRVLVAGGLGNGGTNLIGPSGHPYTNTTQAQVYDPVLASWTPTAELLRPRDGHTLTALDTGGVLAVGGIGSWPDTNGACSRGSIILYDCTYADPAEVWTDPSITAVSPGPRFTGDASALYLQGVTLLPGGPAPQQLPNGGQGLCEAHVDSPGATTPATTSGRSLVDACLPTKSLAAAVDTETVTTSGSFVDGGVSTRSTVASLALLPGQGTNGADLLDVTGLDSQASASCTGGASGTPSAYSSIARTNLMINGTRIETKPVGDKIYFNPTGSNQKVLYGNPIWVNPLGGKVPMAIVTLNYSSYDPESNSQVSSPIEVEFPAGGPLASVVVGKVFLSYAQAGVSGCHA